MAVRGDGVPLRKRLGRPLGMSAGQMDEVIAGLVALRLLKRDAIDVHALPEDCDRRPQKVHLAFDRLGRFLGVFADEADAQREARISGEGAVVTSEPLL